MHQKKKDQANTCISHNFYQQKSNIQSDIMSIALIRNCVFFFLVVGIIRSVPFLVKKLHHVVKKNKQHEHDVVLEAANLSLREHADEQEQERKKIVELDNVKLELLELREKYEKWDAANLSLREKVDEFETSFREKNKTEDAREMAEEKEAMKTQLELAYYNIYVLEKKKNKDFPEEKQRACDILPLIHLSIADKIDIGRILSYRNFDLTFPVPNDSYSNFFYGPPFTKNNDMYVRFLRRVVYTIHAHIYNITKNTSVIDVSDMNQYLSLLFDVIDDVDAEKKRLEDRNKILHRLEQS